MAMLDEMDRWLSKSRKHTPLVTAFPLGAAVNIYSSTDE
jgi:hypothetical protein